MPVVGALLNRGRNLSRQAERMTGRVEQHLPPVGGWLHRGPRGTQQFRLDDRRLRVAHREVQMDLLGNARLRSRRRPVGRDLHSVERHAIAAHDRSGRTREYNLAAERRGPELSQRLGVSAIQRDHSASSDCHGVNLNPGGRPRTQAGSGARVRLLTWERARCSSMRWTRHGGVFIDAAAVASPRMIAGDGAWEWRDALGMLGSL